MCDGDIRSVTVVFAIFVSRLCVKDRKINRVAVCCQLGYKIKVLLMPFEELFETNPFEK